MDLVTVSDHDSIDAAEALRRHADFFVSEEVTCRMPSGNELHVGVYDLTERQHVEIQRRRNDLPRLVAYLNEQQLFYSVNHAFSALTGRRSMEDFVWFDGAFPAVEVRNGHVLERCNRLAERMAEHSGRAMLGGSDAHTLHSLGSVCTHVPGARNKAEFLEGLRRGRGQVEGRSGSFWRLTRDVLQIGAALMEEKAGGQASRPPGAGGSRGDPAQLRDGGPVRAALGKPLGALAGSGKETFHGGNAGCPWGGERMTLPGHMLDYIATRDHRLMRRVHRWRPPRWFRLWMILATRGGDGWLWYGLSALVLVFGGSTRYEAVTAAWTACGAGAILFLVLKKLTGRKRPNALVPHCWATLLPPDQFSFPSGHTITAFAFTVAVGSFYPHLMGRPAVLRAERGHVTHCAGNALPE